MDGGLPYGFSVLETRVNTAGQEIPVRTIGPFALERYAVDWIRCHPYDMTIYRRTVIPAELPNTVIGI